MICRRSPKNEHCIIEFIEGNGLFDHPLNRSNIFLMRVQPDILWQRNHVLSSSFPCCGLTIKQIISYYYIFTVDSPQFPKHDP